MATAPVDSRVSLSLDPEAVKELIEGYSERTAGFVTELMSAVTDAHATLGKLHTARQAWLSNPASTKENAILTVAKEARPHFERIAKRFDRAHDELKKRIAHVEGELAQPLKQHAENGGIPAEVRAHCKSLKRDEREKLLREALESDADDVLRSILGAPAFLSGLTPIDHRHYTEQYNAKKQPELVERLTTMRSALELIYRTAPLLHREFQKAVGGDHREVRAIEEADAKARAALNIEPTA